MLSYMKVLEPRGIRSQLLPFHRQKAQVTGRNKTVRLPLISDVKDLGPHLGSH